MTPMPPDCAMAIAMRASVDGIHRGSDNGNVKRDGAGDAGADIGLGGQDVR